MIMMRSTPSTKIGKPPPPVPPRPSKNLVQEALIKTRRNMVNPTRIAPPVPETNELSKSKSSINIVLKKPTYERSISDDLKTNTRPVVYMSSNLKSKVTRSDSIKKNVVNITNNVSETNIKDIMTNSNDSLTTKDKLDDNCCSSGNSSNNSLDKKWDNMLSDRNHVNTLIDEMFASVLETEEKEYGTLDEDYIAIVDDSIGQITINNHNVSSTISLDGSIPIEINSVDTSSYNKDLEVPKTVIVIKDSELNKSNMSVNTSIENKSNSSTTERGSSITHVVDDKINHEFLISELQSMKEDQDRILRRQRKPSLTIYDSQINNIKVEQNGLNNSDKKIQCSDWVEVGDRGEEVLKSSCQITIEDLKNKDNVQRSLDDERLQKMSLHGLPPLPKSLSGFNLLDQNGGVPKPPTPVRSSSMRSGQAGSHGHLVFSKTSANPQTDSIGRKTTNLDTQLAILRREMYSLRQLDLSLLSQLWSLNESIQDFRQILQDQDDRVLSPPSPSPTPSSGDEQDGDEYYMSSTSINLRPAPPPPPIRRPSNSSNNSSLG